MTETKTKENKKIENINFETYVFHKLIKMRKPS